MSAENNLENEAYNKKSKQMDELIEAVKMITFELNNVRKDLREIQETIACLN